MTLPQLKCPQCLSTDQSDFSVYTQAWLQWPTLELVPGLERQLPQNDDSVECNATYDDEPEPCLYRAPFVDFVRCGSGLNVEVADYTDEHGGQPPKPPLDADDEIEDEDDDNGELEVD